MKRTKPTKAIDTKVIDADLQARLRVREEELASGAFVELEDDELEHFNLDAFQEVEDIESTEYGIYCLKTNPNRKGV